MTAMTAMTVRQSDSPTEYTHPHSPQSIDSSDSTPTALRHTVILSYRQLLRQHSDSTPTDSDSSDSSDSQGSKRPFAPTAPERRSAATEYLMGVYTTRNNYCELTALKFRRPIALLSWKTTQTGRADSIAPGHRHIGHFA